MTNDITIAQAQQRVDEWIKTIGVRYFGELTNLGILDILRNWYKSAVVVFLQDGRDKI